MISNGELSDPLWDSLNGGMTLVRLRKNLSDWISFFPLIGQPFPISDREFWESLNGIFWYVDRGKENSEDTNSCYILVNAWRQSLRSRFIEESDKFQHGTVVDNSTLLRLSVLYCWEVRICMHAASHVLIWNRRQLQLS